MSHKDDFEKIYTKPGAAIWTLNEPPTILKELVETGTIKPCRTLDIACGEGTAAIYLASKGFTVTAIDFSEKAIEFARENARKKGVEVEFRVMDALDLSGLNQKFDFIFEWAIIHHLQPEKVEAYIAQLPGLLNANGLYLTNSFNTESTSYGKTGDRIRKTPIGTELFYMSMREKRDLLEKHFTVLREERVDLVGQGVSQPGNFFLAKKK